VVPLSTIQVEDDVKKKLFSVAAELQSKLGKRVSLSEAIKVLLEAYRAEERDVPKMLSLFGCLGTTSRARARSFLRELRAGEDRSIEGLAGKHNA